MSCNCGLGAWMAPGPLLNCCRKTASKHIALSQVSLNNKIIGENAFVLFIYLFIFKYAAKHPSFQSI